MEDISDPRLLRYCLVCEIMTNRPFMIPEEVIKNAEMYFNYINSNDKNTNVLELVF